MDPIKPIEGTVSNAQEQAQALTEVLRERYWQQRADRTGNTVKQSDQTAEAKTAHKEKQADPAPKAMSGVLNTYAEFSVDRETKRVIVRIIDGNSGELVRTIPPEDLAKEIAKGKLKTTQIRRRSLRL